MKLMTHVVVGYPSLKDTVSLVKTMAEYADYIELQIPFSDPLADGPTIMKACETSLQNGTKVADAFTIMQELTDYFNPHPERSEGSYSSNRDSSAKPQNDKKNLVLLFMCYYNTVFQYGVEKFIQDAKQAGCKGLIVPDIPLEEDAHDHFYTLCRKYTLPVIFVVSPVTPDKRLKKIAQHAQGFVYATARQGITGARKELDMQTVQFLKRVKKFFTIPVAVGFGISKREHIQALRSYADIAVVGSALLDIVNRKESVKDFLETISVVE